MRNKKTICCISIILLSSCVQNHRVNEELKSNNNKMLFDLKYTCNQGVVKNGRYNFGLYKIYDGYRKKDLIFAGANPIFGNISNEFSTKYYSSAAVNISSDIFRRNRSRQMKLKDIAKKLEDAFNNSGYHQIKYYAVPDGFALVSQIEQFNADGTSKEQSDRWAVEFRPPRILSLASYFCALFTANPGRYRVITFVVTSEPLAESKIDISHEEAIAWLDSGAMVLPESIGKQPYTDEYYCAALIYEFEQRGKETEPIFKKPSELSAQTHLEKSKLWLALEK